jgi:hypothetical protein
MNTNTNTDFIEALMTHILEGTLIPKVQIERAVGPILGFFIDRVLSATLNQKIVTLCPEFPIRKGRLDGTEDTQSTNIDWLLYNETKNELILLELKTCDTSFRASQKDTYTTIQNLISSENAGFLIEDIEKIKSKSQEYGKYDFVLEKLTKYKQAITECNVAQIIYLMPESSKIPQDDSAKNQTHRYSFKDLSEEITHPYAEYWKIIRNHLIDLDSDTRRKRNNQSENSDRDNHQGQLNYDQIITKCLDKGDEILVGFEGGVGALKSAEISYLQTRRYKWDNTECGKGTKDARNWIKGSAFLENIPGDIGQIDFS